MRNENIYALYRGEQNVWDGTLDEIAAKTHIKRETLKFYTYPIARKRGNTVMILLEKVENGNSHNRTGRSRTTSEAESDTLRHV